MTDCTVDEVNFLEPADWQFRLGKDHQIVVRCLWRIITAGRIILTSQDHRQQFGLPAPIDAAAQASGLLSDVQITAVELREATADLFIDFAGDLRLEVIPDSSGYESWEVSGPGGVRFVAQGGGQICSWTENA